VCVCFIEIQADTEASYEIQMEGDAEYEFAAAGDATANGDVTGTLAEFL